MDLCRNCDLIPQSQFSTIQQEKGRPNCQIKCHNCLNFYWIILECYDPTNNLLAWTLTRGDFFLLRRLIKISSGE